MRHHSHTARSIRPRRPRHPVCDDVHGGERAQLNLQNIHGHYAELFRLLVHFLGGMRIRVKSFQRFKTLYIVKKHRSHVGVFSPIFLNTRAARIATMPTINTIKGAHTSNVTAVGILIGATIKIMLPVQESHKTVAVGIIRRSFGFVRCLHRRIAPRRQC